MVATVHVGNGNKMSDFFASALVFFPSMSHIKNPVILFSLFNHRTEGC